MSIDKIVLLFGSSHSFLLKNYHFHYYFIQHSYGVSDPHTGDNKHAEETLVNGVVHGSYSLTEPDGTIRKGKFYEFYNKKTSSSSKYKYPKISFSSEAHKVMKRNIN